MSENQKINEEQTLKETLQKIISGEKDFPVKLEEVSGHDFRAFEAGYHAYEKLLKQYLQTILEG